MKTAQYYRGKPSELNKSLLAVIPESPRVPHSGLPPNSVAYDLNNKKHRAACRSNFDEQIKNTF